jgi:hypothetical protein
MYASRLTLACSMFSDNDLKVFSFNIRKRSVSLVYLGLGDNTIGDEGMKTFSTALSSGSLRSLQTLWD